eukprot:CAMPEP_0170076630 /NCGR_PEP_ID=MMETSP0019_2-20121128/13601_1 /TAXON_ID=98059 /ORGANISM="Dinobryon sp., Strain UTEXLB2267" /LENGTH=123 /DNA_ID=CAMNT_0010288459 /DNA_START=350 /DNA_END=721 /DNA_ORIENTATION=+
MIQSDQYILSAEIAQDVEKLDYKEVSRMWTLQLHPASATVADILFIFFDKTTGEKNTSRKWWIADQHTNTSTVIEPSAVVSSEDDKEISTSEEFSCPDTLEEMMKVVHKLRQSVSHKQGTPKK